MLSTCRDLPFCPMAGIRGALWIPGGAGPYRGIRATMEQSWGCIGLDHHGRVPLGHTLTSVTEDELISLRADTVPVACHRMQLSDLAASSDSVAEAALIPAKPCWERKAAAHAKTISMLGDATGDPALMPAAGLAADWTYDLAVAAGPTAGSASSGCRTLSGHTAA